MGRATAGAILASILAVAAPVLAALFFAQHKAINDKQLRVVQIVAHVLRRSEGSGDEVSRDFAALARAGPPCAAASLQAMENLAARSQSTLGLGQVVDDHVRCSSFGAAITGSAVGPPDYRSATNLWVRTGAPLPGIPGIRFIMVTDARTGLTAIIHPDMPEDAFTEDPAVSVGLYGYTARRPLSQKGGFRPDLTRALAPGETSVVREGGQIAAFRRSRGRDYVAYAAMPIAGIDSDLRHEALVLTPIGLAAGALLAVVIVTFVRASTGLRALLRSGLRRGELFVVYQPVVDLRTGAWVGAEALLRWRRPSGELIRPDIFIPFAEENGLIGRVTERVLHLVGTDAAGLFARRPGFYLSVNLSSADLISDRTVGLLKQLLERTGAAEGNILAEATERSLLPTDASLRVLREMRALGVRLAVDDFGTGYSNLAYLQSFDLNALKIDKTFVDSLETGAATSQVVSHIIAMAQDLGLDLIAEGVETEGQAEALRQRGVRYAQGWLFAKPMAFADLDALLEAGDPRPEGDAALSPSPDR